MTYRPSRSAFASAVALASAVGALAAEPASLYVSPSGNGRMLHLPGSRPLEAQIACARGALAVPLKIFTMRQSLG